MKASELQTIAGWFAGRLPDGWFTGAPSVTSDGKQIKVVGKLPEPALEAGAPAGLRTGAEEGRIGRFREETRGYRIHVAREAEQRFQLPVQWGAACGKSTVEFTPGGSGRRGEGGQGRGRGRRGPDVQSF